MLANILSGSGLCLSSRYWFHRSCWHFLLIHYEIIGLPFSSIGRHSSHWAQVPNGGICDIPRAAVTNYTLIKPVWGGHSNVNWTSDEVYALNLTEMYLNPPGAPSLIVLQTVGFGDKLFFRKLPESAVADSFGCNMEGVPTDASNLVLRALDLFRGRTSSNRFYEVRRRSRFRSCEKGLADSWYFYL